MLNNERSLSATVSIKFTFKYSWSDYVIAGIRLGLGIVTCFLAIMWWKFAQLFVAILGSFVCCDVVRAFLGEYGVSTNDGWPYIWLAIYAGVAVGFAFIFICTDWDGAFMGIYMGCVLTN